GSRPSSRSRSPVRVRPSRRTRPVPRWRAARRGAARAVAVAGAAPSGGSGRRGRPHRSSTGLSCDRRYQVRSVSVNRLTPSEGTHPMSQTPRTQSAPATPAQAPQVRRAAILGGNRIPFARAHKQYARASNQDMLTSALDGLVARFGLAGQRMGEVAGGAVIKHSRDLNLTREAVLGSALSPETPAFDLGQACATGLETTV